MKTCPFCKHVTLNGKYCTTIDCIMNGLSLTPELEPILDGIMELHDGFHHMEQRALEAEDKLEDAIKERDYLRDENNHLLYQLIQLKESIPESS